VKLIGGAPTFVVNGRPHSGMCYSTYDCNPDSLRRRARQFAHAGCDLYNYVVEISGYGYSRPMWVGPDEWDFGDFDQRARTVVEANPHALLLPRIYVDAPAWWRAQHPEELMLLDNGTTSFGEQLFALPRAADYPSLASERWRADMRAALATVVRHIEQSEFGPRVVGYQLSGQKTEEWYHWSMCTPTLGDYSPHMVRAFQAWLQERHGTDEQLQAAWGRPDVTLDTAPIPTHEERFGDQTQAFRDPVRERNVIDFHTFWSDIMADTIAEFARVVQEETGRRKIVGAFYAYTFEFTDLGEDAGHLAVARLLRSPDIDFIMAPSSYFNRNLPGAPYFRAPVASLTRHGKLFWDDFDQPSYKYYEKLKENPALKQWEYQMGLTKTPEEFVWMCVRETGMALAQGVQVAHFDIHGGYYEDPVIMRGVRRLAQIREEALQLEDRGSSAEILVLADEGSEHLLTFRHPVSIALRSAQIGELPFVAPYDTALLSDLAELDTSRYRLVLMVNAFRLDAQQRRLIRQKLLRGDRTVVWFYAPGYFDEARCDPALMADITGMRIVPDSSPSAAETAHVVEAAPQQPAPASARSVSVGQAARLPSTPPGEAPGGLAALTIPLLRGQRFIVDDPAATPLATVADGSGKVVIAQKQMLGWTSVYTSAAPLPAALLKHLTAEAGVHIYDDDPTDLLFANRHYLPLATDAQGGESRIRLPRQATVTDLMSGEVVCEGSDQFTVAMRPKEARLLGLR